MKNFQAPTSNSSLPEETTPILKAVIEELDQIEEFMRCISYIVFKESSKVSTFLVKWEDCWIDYLLIM